MDRARLAVPECLTLQEWGLTVLRRKFFPENSYLAVRLLLLGMVNQARWDARKIRAILTA
jgi:hypothetical protein